MNDFLNRVRNELDYMGLSQKELAEKTGISVNTIRGWFSKNLTPDVVAAVKVAKVLNVSVEYLVSGETETYKKRAKIIELLHEIESLV